MLVGVSFLHAQLYIQRGTSRIDLRNHVCYRQMQLGFAVGWSGRLFAGW